LGTLELRGSSASRGADVGVVMVRPEQLDVRACEDGAGAEGVRGRVEQCRYYGHDALLHIRPEQPEAAEVLLARVHGEQALPIGTRVAVAARGPVTTLR